MVRVRFLPGSELRTGFQLPTGLEVTGSWCRSGAEYGPSSNEGGNMRLRIFFALVLVLVLPLLAVSAYADGVLPTQLASFAVLGASTVTNTGSTTLVSGNVGVDPGMAIVPGSTGFTFAGPSAGMTIVNGIANTAQNQLDTGMGLLGGLATSGP